MSRLPVLHQATYFTHIALIWWRIGTNIVGRTKR
jgi:hypothetical protein